MTEAVTPAGPTWLLWSSGKDSAWALQVLRETTGIDVTRLVTTVNSTYGRVAMHAVRRELLQVQAAAVGLPLRIVEIPDPCTEAAYAAIMRKVVDDARGLGVTHMAFGDLFLDDVRAYRERNLAGTGITPLFPLWGTPSGVLARRMIDAGVRAYVTCVDPRHVAKGLAGREFDRTFLDLLPERADPCGENGEFHTFVFDGPMFAEPLDVALGEVVEREGFVFADVTVREAPGSPVGRLS
jgi:uncharacterized protein (TIGR00290 family)